MKNRSLPDDKLLELLLLTSLISFTVDSSDQKSTDLELTVFDKRLLSMEIYAAVGGYLETLKQLHHLRLLLGSKLPPNSGCSTYFSGEVFLKVCHTLMQSTRSSSTAGKSTKSASGLSCRAVESVISKFAEISDRKRFWSHYTNIRGAMQRMKELVALPSGVARANVASKSAATAALENTMRSNGYISVDGFDLRPPDATPPLPLSSPSHLQTSVNARSVRGLMTSKPTERTSTDDAVEPEPEPSTSVSLKGMMQTLPVFDHREEILKNVAINQLTSIQGETGCGKSTSVPQFFYNAWARAKASFERPVNIYVTQPRRIAAIELTNTVARMREGNAFDEVGQVGQVVGYRIGQKHVTSSKTKITYVTTGYMVERIIHDPEALTKITHLVLDEVHERSMDVDLLLLLLKLKFKNHPQVRVVIMSATMDAKLLIHYLANALAARLVNRKPLCVGSKLYPVEDIYLDKLSDHFPGLSQRGQQDLVLMKDQFKRLSKPQHMTNSKLARKSIMNIHDNQLKLIKEMDMDDDVDSTDQVDLTLSKEGAEEFKCLSGRQKDRLFNQLAGSDNPDDELAGLAYRGNTVSIHAYPTPRNQGGDEENCFDEVAKGTVERTGFPVSLIYYIRGGRIPVNLGIAVKLEEHGTELGFMLKAVKIERPDVRRSSKRGGGGGGTRSNVSPKDGATG
ncbi:ATP-dependent RNA helicase spindle-E [Phytophthora nicotianae]|uniref:ATP-dependent RNA helicase spindle-E n=1 Tax=Phytophthora nicotianae TaxID=4792 RepID=A0A0W8DJL7_PHYNI|nr:ATP-dependent RNA helicase spindle-E [Phytophthora nicotianae]